MRKWIANRYASYTPDGKFWLSVGFACLVVDMAIGYLAGYSVATFWHGVGYAALAAGFAFLPDAAYEEYENRRYGSAIVMALLCIPIGVKAYEQQLTYSAGMRSGEMQAAGVQNTRYEGAQTSVTESAANLAMWRDQKLALQSERGKMLEASPWATTLTAEALRKESKDLDDKIASEMAGGRGGRGKGCKAVCENLKDEKVKIEKQIAAIERLDVVTAKIADLDKQVEATQRVLDGKRATAATTEHKQSLNVDVARMTARLFKIAIGAKADEVVKDDETTQQLSVIGSAGLGALALLVLAPVGFFLAGRRRIHAPKDSPRPTPSSILPTSPEPHGGQVLRPSPPMTARSMGDINRDKLNRLLAGHGQGALAA